MSESTTAEVRARDMLGFIVGIQTRHLDDGQLAPLADLIRQCDAHRPKAREEAMIAGLGSLKYCLRGPFSAAQAECRLRDANGIIDDLLANAPGPRGTCGDCEFWQDGVAHRGRCRRYPKYEPRDSTDECGEFSPNAT